MLIPMEAAAAREQIDRLVQSKTFETSEVHRRLLHYLAEKTLSGEADRLKEYTIGLEAFGKPPSYDPKQDSIVRLQVGRLRQKLALYYQNEANGDLVQVTVPKGAFKLSFEPRRDHRPQVSEDPPPWRRPWLVAVALAAVGIWAVVATILLVRANRIARPALESWTPELEALWTPFLESHRPLLVSLGTPLFIRIPEIGFVRDPRTNDWQDVEKSERTAAVRKLAGDREMLPSFAFTGAGEASASFLIARLLATRKTDLLLTRSSILSWQQIVDHDVVFLGPPKFNRQLQEAALMQDIVVEADGIRNRRPQSGEPQFLQDQILPGKTNEGETHALITRSRGPSGVGELLMIAGNASPDTFAAAEWLTQPWRARELARHLRTPEGKLPRHFQVVLKVAFKQGIPVQSSYVFHHALP